LEPPFPVIRLLAGLVDASQAGDFQGFVRRTVARVVCGGSPGVAFIHSPKYVFQDDFCALTEATGVPYFQTGPDLRLARHFLDQLHTFELNI